LRIVLIAWERPIANALPAAARTIWRHLDPNRIPAIWPRTFERFVDEMAMGDLVDLDLVE
jgi:hypothetical protein